MTKKKAITIIASEEAYKNLATFNDINELNEAVRTHKETHSDNLNKNQLRILNLLHRYSAKFKGVSFLTKNNIANQLDISRRTVIRACQRLEELNIIKQYETKRKSDMQQSSNAIVIQQIPDEENDNQNGTLINNVTQEVTQESANYDENCHSSKTTSFEKQSNNNKRNTRTHTHENTDNQFDYTSVSSNVPASFIDNIKPFFNDADTIYKLYSRLTLAIRNTLSEPSKSGYRAFLNDHIDKYIKSFKESLYRHKTRYETSIKSDLFGYLYGTFCNVTRQIIMRNNAVSGVYYNWLNE